MSAAKKARSSPLINSTTHLRLSFIAVAAIVTEWETPNRITALLAALAWGLITGACLYLARLLLTGSLPFANIGSEISRDLSVEDSGLTMDKSIPPVQLLHTMHVTRAELAQRLAEVPIGDPPSLMLRKVALSVGIAIAAAVLVRLGRMARGKARSKQLRRTSKRPRLPWSAKSRRCFARAWRD